MGVHFYIFTKTFCHYWNTVISITVHDKLKKNVFCFLCSYVSHCGKVFKRLNLDYLKKTEVQIFDWKTIFY